MVDVVSALETSLIEVRAHAAREMDFFAPRIQELESRTGGLTSKVEKLALDIEMMSGLVQKHLNLATELSLQIKLKAQSDGRLSTDLQAARSELDKMSQLAMRRGHIASIAMVARRTTQSKSKQILGEIENLAIKMSNLQMQSDAKQAILDVYYNQTLQLNEEIKTRHERERFWKCESAKIQAEYDEHSVEFESLNRRFAAMFENGMTAEKEHEFVAMRSDLENTRSHNKEQYYKIQELEARIFELELTMGSVGSDGKKIDRNATKT